VWAVLYDDGMSLTTASERIARSLAEAERQRGRSVTVRHLVAGADSVPEPEPSRPVERFTRPKPVTEPEPASAEEPEPAPAEEPEPARAEEPEPGPAEPEPLQDREPAHPLRQPEPIRAPGPAFPREPEPARTRAPARRRRLLLYALAAASIVVAAALVDHWGMMPRVGASTISNSTQVGGSPHRPQLLPPLGQPPVMHFSTGESSGGPSTIARGG
jgi:hypothetical protein